MRATWRDARDRRPHAAVLLALLVALFAGAGIAPAAVVSLNFASGPVNLLEPSITGDSRIGGVLTCTRGTWDDSDREPYAVEYAWARDDQAIAGAESATHTVKAEDAGTALTCEVTAHDRYLSTTVESFGLAIEGPMVRSAPVLSGDDRLGGELACTRGTWDDRGLAQPYAVEYAWLRDGDPIAGATTPTHSVSKDDAGHVLVCEVTAAEATSADSGPAFPDGPRSGIPPQIGGDVRVGGVATCTSGSWDGTYQLTYAWLRDGDPLALATTSSYRVDPLDAGHELACRVIAEGLTAVDSPPVFPAAPASRNAPEISGDGRLGGTLTCSPGTWDADYALTYEWRRDGAPAGTGAQRVNTADDLGHALTCAVTAQGVTTLTSAAVAPTAPLDRTGPTIDGDTRLGRTVTCDPGAWDGPYALTIEWLRDDDMVGSGAQHAIVAPDVQHGLHCRVTAAGITSASSRTALIGLPRSLIAPSISGDPRPGGTLTCGRGTWDEPAGAPYATTYAWEPAGSGATITAEAGATYRCLVTVAGLASADSPAVTVSEPGTDPENRSAPFVTGSPKLGATLTCDPGTWNGAYTFIYEWRRDGAAAGTGTTHGVALEDLDHALACAVTTGTVTALSAPVAPASPVALAPPEIKGTPHLGRTLTCASGAWDGDYPLSVQWSSGDTGPTHVVTAGDQSLTCTVRAAATAAMSAPVDPTAPQNLVAPTLTGDPRVGGTLTCGAGDWDDTYALTQQWRHDDIVIAAGATYLPAPADVGSALHCTVTAGGVTVATRDVTVRAPEVRAVPVVGGTPRLYGSLSCAPGEWDGAYAFSFRWLREGAPVGTGTSYALVAADAGHELTCEVTAAGLRRAESAPVTVTAPRSVAGPGVSGDPRVGAALTCTPGNWDGDYALTSAWRRDGDPVGTGATYTVVAADVGAALTCDVTAEGLTTATTGPVSPHGPQALTPPAISGDPLLRGTLRCSTGSWDGTYALSYQWSRDGDPIAGQTGSAYAVTRDDLDSHVACTVTAEGLEASSSAPASVSEPTSIDGVRIEGPAHPRRTLTCDPGRWNDRDGLRYQLSYQWFHDVEGLRAVPGADQATYVVRSSDLGYQMRCIVTAEGEWEARSGEAYVSWEDIGLYLTPDADSAQPGAANGYTLTLRNPNPLQVTEDELQIDLPAGFTYTAGSTTGLTTGNPTISNRRLTWDGIFTLPPEGQATLHFLVSGATDPGDYRAAEAEAQSSDLDFFEQYAFDAARITVEAPVTCTITGTPGDDVLTGTSGDDVICGLGGNDRIAGGAGNDTLAGGDGDDLLDGGAGADVFRGGGGRDTVNYSERTTPVDVTIADAHPDGTPPLDSDGDGVDDVAAEGDDVRADVEIVRGGRAGDRLIGSAGDEELYGGAGDDVLDGRGGDDLLDGGAGDDELTTSDGRYDHALCGAGLDTYRADDHDKLAGCEREEAILELTP